MAENSYLSLIVIVYEKAEDVHAVFNHKKATPRLGIAAGYDLTPREVSEGPQAL